MSKLFFCFIFFVSFAAQAASEPIKFGVYKLKGSNPDGIKKYEGKLVIQKEGTNYRVTWFIGDKGSQNQSGIGILENNVLSIGYMDMSGKDFGVVGMRIINNKRLKGKWTSIFSQGSFGEEEFIFEKETIPPELLPKPTKGKNTEEQV